ncbi:undecaprenyldiphospho-muramoylpentapeptide beta-N-acetylglucosaminyltransferase [Denitrobaculum tricleocarpae]|uniref:UDP-N-acetylglucosamine--N-acetylmuramyl-(pentapeptide) pyrophosphoryl-undecaprenol N-acetylglucosamine transferase n=1 Tax=Denitrobaculum tricleocarpae TaxID=2591009 RepID=A0A545T0U3_9PROT|nr:undecaprenyldiphospho-muramoylpentapeptide beta-N-acetylglucosaminyltransferase [Denitrobaculum tricleocarpae]TQV70832.1 undecaprenyldiphospho-muramoylpentapeptide beta-N-acetylglucosaminyltransferase [Denitrobaculum tricleocarpae]
MTLQNPRRVILAAGGTGGHLFPAEALAQELLARDIEVLLVTDQRGGGFGNKLPNVKTLRIAAAGIAGGGVLRKVKGVIQLGIGYLQARKILKAQRPDAVVGFGGYPSVPTVLAAAHLGQPVILHEQNAVLGRANRLLARRANAIATSFEKVDAISKSDLNKVVRTGNPVRAAIAAVGAETYESPEGSDVFRLLVIGGSQGAKVFNELVPGAVALLPESLRARLAVMQQVPGGEIERVTQEYDDSGVKHELAAFFSDMPERLKSAHLIICRSGASTVCELAAAGRPAILVPYPYAIDNHQTANAQALTSAGGGWLMPQGTLTAESLAQRLRCLLSTPALLKQASQGAASCAENNAAGRLADVVCGTFQGTAGKSLNGDTSTAESEQRAAENKNTNREATA